MKMFFRAVALLTMSLAIASCAEKHEDDAYDIEQRSLDAWMAENKPGATRYDDGLYIEWLTRNDGGAQVEYGNWFQLDYTGKTLDGNVFKTRNADIARKEGTFTLKTNYVPDFINYYELNGLTSGENTTIGRMKEGEKVIAYIPSRLGYQGIAQSFTNGYGGHYTIYSVMIPMQVEMELVKIYTNASVRETELVEAYAESIGMTEDDLIEDGLYIKKLTEKPDEAPGAGGGRADGEEESDIVSPDESVHIYVRISVIQENSSPDYDPATDPVFETFLVDTNIDSLTRKYWKDYTSYGSKSIIPQYASSEYIAAFKSAFENLDIKWQSSFRIVTTSDHAYAEYGNSDLGLTAPYGVIAPFTPLVIDVYVQKKDFETGDDPATDYGEPVA